MLDEFTRESLAIEVATSLNARNAIMTLQYMFALRDAPRHLRSDNGRDFVATGFKSGWRRHASARSPFRKRAPGRTAT